jgi:hypothetical protein
VVNIEIIDLSTRNVTLPSDRVGMVIAQPHLSLTAVEPYRCTTQAKPQQLTMISETLNVAQAARHGAPKTHFTIFPEYSIPGTDGIALIEAALQSAHWQNGTIVIGGTDALTKLEFATLANSPGTHLDSTSNSLDRVTDNEWINCGITWVKAANGTVERWLQPKLSPAWPELNINYQHMFRGNSVFIFKGPFEDGTLYRFCSLVCFDWIANVENRPVWKWVLEDLERQATQAQAELALSWLFVVQRNPKPSHDTFLTEVSKFFDQTTLRRVRRDRTCLLFANGAGQATPGKVTEYGSTSLVFPPQTLFAQPKCSPTFSNGGARFRISTLLSSYRDVLFRECGACIHSFVQVNPNSLQAGPAGRTIPVENAFVFPLGGTIDRRAPSDAVPACVKWLNDELDHVPGLSVNYPRVPLAPNIDATHRQTVAALRQISPQSATSTVKLAAQESKAEHADDWNQTEHDALEHLVHTLDIVSLGCPPPTVGVDSSHASVVLNRQTVDLLAIRGESHEKCLKHCHALITMPRRQLLLISRDPDNNQWLQRFGSFLSPGNPRLGQERNITDPASGLLHLGYRNLLDVFQQTATVTDVPGAIDAELAK